MSGPFAAALQARRTRFNSLFADTRRLRTGLDGEALGTHLAHRVLDGLVITTSRAEQMGALPGVLERFPPGRVLWAGPP